MINKAEIYTFCRLDPGIPGILGLAKRAKVASNSRSKPDPQSIRRYVQNGIVIKAKATGPSVVNPSQVSDVRRSLHRGLYGQYLVVIMPLSAAWTTLRTEPFSFSDKLTPRALSAGQIVLRSSARPVRPLAWLFWPCLGPRPDRQGWWRCRLQLRLRLLTVECGLATLGLDSSPRMSLVTAPRGSHGLGLG